MTEKRVFEGMVEDIGQEELWNSFLAIRLNEAQSNDEVQTIYVPTGGGRRVGEHPLVKALAGKRVRVTIETCDPEPRCPHCDGLLDQAEGPYEKWFACPKCRKWIRPMTKGELHASRTEGER